MTMLSRRSMLYQLVIGLGAIAASGLIFHRISSLPNSAKPTGVNQGADFQPPYANRRTLPDRPVLAGHGWQWWGGTPQ